jgi:lipopolysaccharide/colanic/teichoic acid biosynthesis glycosyltransferase
MNFYINYGKNVFDCFFAVVGLLIFFVPMFIICILVVFFDGFPIFYRQNRIGKNCRTFSVLKFRTMKNVHKEGSVVTVKNDRRITKLGYFLRKYKLDELPQLINILKGQMSFVGPRPDVHGYLDKLDGEKRILWSIKPGITSPATIAFRNEEEILASQDDPVKYNDEVIYPKKVEINMLYARHVSLVEDIKIILQTLWCI